MPGGAGCPRCGGSARESIKDLQYCLECGLVVSDLQLVHEDHMALNYLAAGQDLPAARGDASPAHSRVWSHQKRNPLLLRSVKELLGKLQISQGRLHDRCLDIIGSAQTKWQAEETSGVVPNVLVGLAVYIACREEGHLLYMRDVYDQLGVPAKAFGACFRRIMEDLHLKLPAMGTGQSLASAVGSLLGNSPVKASVLQDSCELADWLQSTAPLTKLSSTPSMAAAMALAIVCSANKGKVQCSTREIAGQFRLSEKHVGNEVLKLRKVLLVEAQSAPWLRHLNNKTVVPHWRAIICLNAASHRSNTELEPAFHPADAEPPQAKDGLQSEIKENAMCAKTRLPATSSSPRKDTAGLGLLPVPLKYKPSATPPDSGGNGSPSVGEDPQEVGQECSRWRKEGAGARDPLGEEEFGLEDATVAKRRKVACGRTVTCKK